MEIKAVAFDVIGTLFDIQPLEKKLKTAGLPTGSLKVWFASVLRDAFALEIAGKYKTFAEVGRTTLEALFREHQVEPERSIMTDIMKSFAELPPHSDVQPAFETVRTAKLAIVPLTNGSAETTKKMFHHAQLDNFLERCISIDEVKHWKPAREVYLHAAKSLDLDPAELALVSAHDWDIHGAKRAGLVTGFVQRHAVFSATMAQADVSGRTLREVAENLLRL